MKTELKYLLTLNQEGMTEPIGRVIIPSADILDITEGLNYIIGQEPNHYELYAKDISVYGGDKGPITDGTYKDGSTWENMNWDCEMIACLVR